MRLTAPIYHLKRRAKALSRQQGISLNQAQDRIAMEEGFSSWGLLAARASASNPTAKLLNRLEPGDLLLLGARPGHGKTHMALELIAQAIKQGRRGVFFTLEYNQTDVLKHFRAIGADVMKFGDQFEFDNAECINAEYIINRLASAPRNTVVAVDYLQLLDQKRENPELAIQVSAMKSFAEERGLIIVFISQIDRSYELSQRPCPGLADVRLPNPLDLTLFSKTCFLNDGKVQIEAVR